MSLIEAAETLEISLSDAFESGVKASIARVTELLPRSGMGQALSAMREMADKFLVLNDRPSQISKASTETRSVTAEVAFLLQQAAERRERSQ